MKLLIGSNGAGCFTWKMAPIAAILRPKKDTETDEMGYQIYVEGHDRY